MLDECHVIVARRFPVQPISVPSTRIPAPEHEQKDAKQWFTEVRDAADGLADGTIAEAGDVLIFVHGYNNDLDVIMKRQRCLQTDLSAEGWRGLVIAFDWPSANSTLNYIEDRQDASEVAHLMVTHGGRPFLESLLRLVEVAPVTTADRTTVARRCVRFHPRPSSSTPPPDPYGCLSDWQAGLEF